MYIYTCTTRYTLTTAMKADSELTAPDDDGSHIKLITVFKHTCCNRSAACWKYNINEKPQ